MLHTLQFTRILTFAITLIVFFSVSVSAQQLTGQIYVGGEGTAPNGADPDYPTLHAAFDALMAQGNDGDVTFLITSDITEADNIALGFDPGVDNTITIKPAPGTEPTLSFTSTEENRIYSGGLILGLEGTEGGSGELTLTRNIHFDGSNTNGGTTRDLTIEMAENALTSNSFRIIGTTENIQIRNLNLLMKQTTGNAWNALQVTTREDAFHENLLIENNYIENLAATSARTIVFDDIGTVETPPLAVVRDNHLLSGRYGIWLRESAGSIEITGNTIELDHTAGFFAYGILVEELFDDEQTIYISGNTFLGTSNNTTLAISGDATATYHIHGNHFGPLTSDDGISRGVRVRSGGTYEIDANTFFDFDGADGVRMIEVANDLEEDHTVTITNNFLTGFASSGGDGERLDGIYIASPDFGSGAIGDVRAYHNTLVMNNLDVTGSGWDYYGLSIFSSSRLKLDLKNNIMINLDENPGVLSKLYRQVGSTLVDMESDYNLWYVANPSADDNTFLSRHGEEEDRALTLADHQATSGFDAASVSKEVTFADAGAGNLRLEVPSDGDTDLAGQPLLDDQNNIIVPTDIDGNERDSELPYMGAFEGMRLIIMVRDLTGNEGFRMLSAPTAITLQELLEPVWTQGVEGGKSNKETDEPNVFTWDSSSDDNDATNWQEADLTKTLTAGTGFLVFVYDDDDPFDGSSTSGFPKTLSASGGEFPAGTQVAVNENENGWSLLGNPFAVPVDFTELDKTNLSDVVYVWDPNDNSGADNPGENDPGAGSWQSFSEGAGTGDLEGGIIAPFQGFFVQNEEGGAASVTFSAAARTEGGAFMGKQAPHQIVRFELNGQGMRNSAWLSFREHGSLDQTWGDAHQLQPLSSNYALLAGVKNDGLFDISVLPQPGSDFEFPLSVDATIGGTYTLSVTDFEYDGSEPLFLVDRVTNVSVPLNGSMSYEFELESPIQKSVANPFELISRGPAKAIADENEARFVITVGDPLDAEPEAELPAELTLTQNYPNPFNPTTVISYEVPEQQHVRLTVYDMLGRQVTVLVDESRSPGRYDVTWDASTLSSGVYIYRLEAGGQTLTRNMTLVK